MSDRRVLLCTDYLPPSGGGVEQVVQTLARRLDDHGYEVGVFTLAGDGPPSLASADAIDVFEADTVDLTGIVGLQSTVSPDAVRRFRSVRDEFQPDLVHVHNRFFFTSYVGGVLYGARSDVPVVTSLHLGDVGDIGGLTGLAARAFERTAGRLLLRRSDHVIAVSDAVAEQAVRLGASPDRVSTVRNAVVVDDFPFDPPEDANVVFIGRLVPNNGPLEFLEAGAGVLDRHPDATLHVVGTGPLDDDVRRRAADLGIASSTTFHGFVEDITDAYELADVFCRPSYSEGLPLTLLESMASGVPPVVTDVAGVPEVVADRSTGCLVAPGDVAGVEDAICWLLDDEERLSETSRRARQYAETELSWDRRVRQVLSVYDSLLET